MGVLGSREHREEWVVALWPPCTEAIGSRLQRILQVTVELKNDLAIMGTMHSVDQYLNIKLDNVKVVNQDKFPHMVRP